MSVKAEQPSADDSGRMEGSLIDDRQGVGETQLAGAAPVVFLAAGGASGGMAAAAAVEFDAKVAESFKPKRGRPPRGGSSMITPVAPAAPAAKRSKKEEEDVCFICFDGGTLVLCDRRDCPKAYHPACVRRDEAFFRGRVRWNCGWHLCNSCQRNAHFMCYTCPFSLCKGCAKQADIFCIRGNKGFCRTCMTTILLIENVAHRNKESGQVDFDDKSSWEYLFKVYWTLLKQKESLTLDEVTQATNSWKGSVLDLKDDFSQKMRDTCVNKAAVLSRDTRQLEDNVSKRRKIQRRPKLHKSKSQSVEKVVEEVVSYLHGGVNWASKELLEFIAHTKDGDTSELSLFDVQTLLLDYIRKNNLRDPFRKCQIICDQRLKTLFGKSRVGHFEMLKLLEYHFKEDSCTSGKIQGAVINPMALQVETDGTSEVIQILNKDEKQQKSQGQLTNLDNYKQQKCRTGDEKGQQTNLDNYAAIDLHNINLIYLKRSSMENLMEDAEKFHDKVVGSIVRIKISGNSQKQDIYRLVRVVGTGRVAEPYKIGSKTANVKLKILNLNKIEDVTIDVISNQEFSEDECRRLRQSIKCGLGERMTVGEIREISNALQTVRVNDSLEAEMLRLNHLRDRASEKGYSVEKLELLNAAEERLRRLHENPKVHADPRMDPSYKSDEDTGQSNIKKQDANTCPTFSNWSPKDMELLTPQRGDDMPIGNPDKEFKTPTSNWEHKRDTCTEFEPGKEKCAAETNEGDHESLLALEGADVVSRILVELRNGVDQTIQTNNYVIMRSDDSSSSLSTGIAVPSDNGDLEKIWYYRDPSGRNQGPFCLFQLHKWSSNGYFPSDLRIWRINETQDQSVLLIDALTTDEYAGKKCNDREDDAWKDREPNNKFSDLPSSTTLKEDNEYLKDQSLENEFPAASEVLTQNSGKSWSLSSGGIEFPDLPSPTPKPDHKDSKGLLADYKHSAAENVPQQDCLGTNDIVSSCGIHFSHFPSTDNKKFWDSEVQQSVASNVTGTRFYDLSTITTDHDNQAVKVQAEENKHFVTSSIPCQDSGISWNIQLPDIALSWGGYSSMNAKHSVEHLGSGLTSSSSMNLIEDYQCTSRWHGMEPLELSTLGDESVSDLLSEVEALESLHGMASPTSRINCGTGEDSIDSPGNDCFSPLVGMSPHLDPGKHDAMSSTCDMQFHSHGVFDVNDLPRASSSHSSESLDEEGELNPTFVSAHLRESVSPAQSPAPMLQLNVVLESSRSPVLEREVKPVFVSTHQETLFSRVHSPAPLPPLPSELSPPTIVSRDQSPAPSLLPPPTIVSQAPLSSPSQLPQLATTTTTSCPGAEGEGADYVFIPQQGLVFKSHFPAQTMKPPYDSRNHPLAQNPMPMARSHPSDLLLPPPVSMNYIQSCVEGELEPAYAFMGQTESVSHIHQPTPRINVSASWGLASETADTAQGPVLGNASESTCMSTNENENMHRSVSGVTFNGGRGSQQRKHSTDNGGTQLCSMDLSYHGTDSGYSRSRPSFEQSLRPPGAPRGQRVCKSYESGHCKKGASRN
ncbi:hypothetical protein Nepgr_027015 [Nepenthes gracilis]|uniref:Zinc finger CCCH domain-containing protein 44 n=1 Tax=Nepenthes gracilis TaxID=150966 RepID=A0AAD3TB09_NEPGR|nr:hypothetical protein Nepgr_027015 [Nepenthes gracilis]